MARSSNAASGPTMTLTLSRSISSCALVLAPAGLPPVSAEMNSILRPASVLAFLFEEHGDALFHLVAALGERAGLDRQQADLEGRALRNRRCIGKGERGRARGHEFATVELERHEFPPGRAPTRLVRASLAQNREAGKAGKVRLRRADLTHGGPNLTGGACPRSECGRQLRLRRLRVAPAIFSSAAHTAAVSESPSPISSALA